MKRMTSIIWIGLSLGACSTIPESEYQTAEVYKSLGSRQCEQIDRTKNIVAMKQELVQNQIKVLSSYITDDGQIRISLCGASDGKIVVFKIPANKIQQAQTFGFQDLNLLKH